LTFNFLVIVVPYRCLWGSAVSDYIEFWRLKKVEAVTGWSKSHIYRKISDGEFPAPERYPDGSGTYWPSDKIQEWQRRCREFNAIADDFMGALG